MFYDGKVKVVYKDQAHRYYAYPRIDFNLPIEDKKAWGKIMYPKGTTTLIGDTLEKKGLQQWPKNVALRELFGFYDTFTGDNDKVIPAGFSKGVGTIWDADISNKDEIVKLLISAANAWKVKQKKGADVGSVVHDAIEHYIKGQPFNLTEEYIKLIEESDYESPDLKALALREAPEEAKQASLAYEQFTKWWDETKPVLYGSEELLYSLEHNVCGTYDGDIGIRREHHPVPTIGGGPIIRVTADWKTSKASTSKEAAMPEGVNYQYFTQSAIYEMIRREMGYEPADDLLIVSCRKDGGFTLIYASELGLTVDDCITAAIATIDCYRFMEKTKKGLLEHAAPEGDK